MISPEQYELFLNNILKQIDCDWVIIGGSLLALLKATDRATTDIDICALSELTNERRLQLMKIAQDSGLSIEAINPAADFFLRQIPNWKESLVLFKNGLNGNLYRPSLALYIRLKLNRGSESDLADCVSFLKWHDQNSVEYDRNELLEILERYTPAKVQDLKILITS